MKSKGIDGYLKRSYCLNSAPCRPVLDSIYYKSQNKNSTYKFDIQSNTNKRISTLNSNRH